MNEVMITLLTLLSLMFIRDITAHARIMPPYWMSRTPPTQELFAICNDARSRLAFRCKAKTCSL